MGSNSSIEWTHHTFNTHWGCTKVSPACDNCYAEAFSKRVGFSDTGSKFPIWGKDAERRFFGDKHWAEPLKWNRAAEKAGERKRVFCGSMCDVMEDREDLFAPRRRLYNLIEATPHLDWLLLTKRPQNFRRFLPNEWLADPRPNVWGMTTVEGSSYRWRASALAETPFVVRGLSCEPLLEDINLRQLLYTGLIHVVIAGAESGHGARRMDLNWVRSLRNQCGAAGAAFFFKQDADDRGHKISTPELDGYRWTQMPEVRS
jgi:protein gp37